MSATPVRTAGPFLLVTTPLGVAFGLREAWRLAGPGMAVLMAAMLGVVGALVWWTVHRIHAERAAGRTQTSHGGNQAGDRPLSGD